MTPPPPPPLAQVLPLFLFCLLAGLLMQSAVDTFLTDKATGHSFIDRETVVRVSNTAQVAGRPPPPTPITITPSSQSRREGAHAAPFGC